MSFGRVVLATMALAALLAPNESRAQRIIRLDPLYGNLSLGYSGYASEAPGVPGSQTNRVHERLSVRLSGSLFGERTAKFDVSVQPAFAQGWWSNVQGSDGDRRDGMFGDARLQLMPGGPVELSVRAFRTKDEYQGVFEERTRTDAEGFAASGIVRTPYMSAAVNYDANESDSRFTSGAAGGGRRALKRNQLQVNLTSSKTRVQHQRLESEDLVRGRDYVRERTLATNRQRWGKGSMLSSRVMKIKQYGVGVVDNLTWGQTAHLQHTSAVSTTLNFTHNDVETPTGSSRGWNAGLTETVRVGTSSSVSLVSSTDHREIEAGTVSHTRVMPRAQATLSLGAGMTATAGGSLGYQRRSQQTGEGGFGTIAGEEHHVPLSGRFLLNEYQPDPASVRITNEDGSIMYEHDVDYRVFESGAFLEVLVIQSGQIESGDNVLVDYVYRVLPTAEGEMMRWEYNVALSAGGLQLRHSRSADESLGDAEGGVPLFGFGENTMAGLTWTGQTPLGALSLNGEWRRMIFDDQENEVYMAEASVGVDLGRTLAGAYSMGWSTRRDGTQTDMLHAQANLSWKPIPRTRIYGRFRAHEWDRGEMGERFVGGAIGGDWQFGLTSVTVEVERSTWDISRQRSETRVEVRLNRLFR